MGNRQGKWRVWRDASPCWHDEKIKALLVIGTAAVAAIATPTWLLWPVGGAEDRTVVPPMAISPAPPLDAALNRALFVPPPVAEPDGDSPAPPDLTGIVGRLPDAAVALVRTSDGSSRTLAIGDGVEGWRLAALARDAAFFTRGGERVRVALPLQ